MHCPFWGFPLTIDFQANLCVGPHHQFIFSLCLYTGLMDQWTKLTPLAICYLTRKGPPYGYMCELKE